MKKIYIILFLIIFVSFGMKINDNKYIVTKIINSSIISAIENFVENGRGTALDSVSSYVYLKQCKSDTSQCYVLRYAVDDDLIYCYNKPLLICSEISGKKILFETQYLYDVISMNGNMLLYLKEEHPNLYEKSRKYFEYLELEHKKGWIEETTIRASSNKVIFYINKDGKLVY